MQAKYPGKYVSESSLHDQTAIVFPHDLNAIGTLFGGRVLDMADRVAAVVARRHAGRECVTLGIDSVRFLAPAHHGDVLVFQASVNRVWRSSMEIGIRCLVEDYRTLARRHIFSAYFTFVALGSGQERVELAPIIPQSDEERRRYIEAEERRRRRLEASDRQGL